MSIIAKKKLENLVYTDIVTRWIVVRGNFTVGHQFLGCASEWKPSRNLAKMYTTKSAASGQCSRHNNILCNDKPNSNVDLARVVEVTAAFDLD